jgi:hypothetical protein
MIVPSESSFFASAHLALADLLAFSLFALTIYKIFVLELRSLGYLRPDNGNSAEPRPDRVCPHANCPFQGAGVRLFSRAPASRKPRTRRGRPGKVERRSKRRLFTRCASHGSPRRSALRR